MYQDVRKRHVTWLFLHGVDTLMTLAGPIRQQQAVLL